MGLQTPPQQYAALVSVAGPGPLGGLLGAAVIGSARCAQWIVLIGVASFSTLVK